jgi:hypothetical protein
MQQPDLFTDQDQQRLVEARKVAMRIAFEEGSVSADLVREKFPLVESIHRNAIGSLFKTKEFIWNGVKKSRTPSRKGGLISVYRLTDEAIAFVEGQYARRKIA